MAERSDLLELAERQYGVVARWQRPDLRSGNCVRSGGWERLTPVVLRRTGSFPGWQQRLMVGLLEAGPGARVSHLSAAPLWRLPSFAAGPIDIIRGGRLKSHVDPGVRLHRPTLLLPHHETEVFGFPVTSIARTIFDLAAMGIPMGRLASVLNQVCNRSPGTLVALHRTLEELACRGRPGIAVMRQLLKERPVGTRLNDTGLEDRFERILGNAGLPRFERQLDLGGHEWLGRVDFYNRDHCLIAEVDSVIHHTSPADKARDRARDEAMAAAGFGIVRVPEEHIWWDTPAVVEAMIDALARHPSRCTAAHM